MKQALTIIMLLIFAIGASGLSKAANANNSMNDIPILVFIDNNTHDHATVSNCCQSSNEEAQTKKPRCIGDMCLNTTSPKQNLLGFSTKFPTIISTQNDVSPKSTFLRPPII